MTEQRLLKVPELAAVLNVNEDTIYQWSASGKIPSFQLPGGGLRFDEGAVLDALRRKVA